VISSGMHLWSRRTAHRAGVAQLAERQPSKLNVASSNLVSRSTISFTIQA
jgi:hypothetical protein